ncbi:hypothetical protein CTEN210_08854 [Chaetoceros tenuissimus]|uniref:G-protein coupled receptors family 1 profile domain-containing protein n=1 Tax=Chaetoceros tenuissimus TaxID=426638 RepID=A0AAD3CUU6_9STRA|nr:hypothetical protein CTEN210_08854 [Chaetoceros tenuissimus]
MAAPKIWQTSAALQISSGSVSFLSSSTLAYMIKTKKNGLHTPYRRLIFAVSAADILQSICFTLGPFLNVSTVPQAFWAVGNTSTCRLDGFLLGLGSTAAPLYTCSLCIYYYCKLQKKMTNEKIAYKVERWLHFVILTFVVATNTYALASNMFNSSTTGTFCKYAVTPSGCRQRPDIFGECNASPDPKSVTIFNVMNLVVLPIVSLFGTLVLFAILIYQIVVKEKIFSSKPPKQCENKITASSPEPQVQSEERTVKQEEEFSSESRISSPNQAKNTSHTTKQSSSFLRNRQASRNDNADDTNTIANAYRQEMMAQLLLYSLAFVLTYLIYVIGIVLLFTGKPVSTAHYIIAQTLYPLQGLFNIAIYIRPAARVTRIRRPGTSWLKAYFLVIKNGGEALQERTPLVMNFKPPSSVKFGVENNNRLGMEIESCDDVSKECKYVDSSFQLSRDNAAFNSSEEFFYVKGGEGESAQVDIEDAIAGIHHNDLDAIVEDSVDGFSSLHSQTSSTQM